MKTKIWVSSELPYKKDDTNRVLYNSVDELKQNFTETQITNYTPIGNKNASVNIKWVDRDKFLSIKRVIVQVENYRPYLYFVDSVNINNVDNGTLSLSLDVFGSFINKNTTFKDKELFIKRMHNNRFFNKGGETLIDFRIGSPLNNVEFDTTKMNYFTTYTTPLTVDESGFSNDTKDIVKWTKQPKGFTNFQTGYYYALIKPTDDNFNQLPTYSGFTRFPFFVVPVLFGSGGYVTEDMENKNSYNEILKNSGDNLVNIVFSAAPLIENSSGLRLVTDFGDKSFYVLTEHNNDIKHNLRFNNPIPTIKRVLGNGNHENAIMLNSYYFKRTLKFFNGDEINLPVIFTDIGTNLSGTFILNGSSITTKIDFSNSMSWYSADTNNMGSKPIFSSHINSVAPSVSDAYQQWMNRSSASYEASKMSNVVSGVVGTMSGLAGAGAGAITGNPAGVIGGIAGAGSSFSSSIMKANELNSIKKDMQKTSGNVKNIETNLFEMSYNLYNYIDSTSGVMIEYEECDSLSSNQIISYHKEFGYKNNRFIKVSSWGDLLKRKIYNFLSIEKFYTNIETSNIPIDLLDDIDTMLFTGIRLWDNENVINDYDTDNVEIALEEV